MGYIYQSLLLIKVDEFFFVNVVVCFQLTMLDINKFVSFGQLDMETPRHLHFM
jgi:hypothetical protein